MGQKSLTTQKKIKDSFICIYAVKNIHTITVKEIVQTAGITRGTFYLYFDNIYDLLLQIEQELEDGLASYFFSHNRQQLSIEENSPFETNQQWFSYCMEHKIYLTALLGPNGDPAFSHRIMERLKFDLNKMMDTEHMANDLTRKYVLEYMSAATLSLVRFWLQNEEEFSSEQVAIVANIIRDGILSKRKLQTVKNATESVISIL